MIWPGHSANLTIFIVAILDRLNSKSYVDVLPVNVLPEASLIKGHYNLFQQDNRNRRVSCAHAHGSMPNL